MTMLQGLKTWLLVLSSYSRFKSRLNSQAIELKHLTFFLLLCWLGLLTFKSVKRPVSTTVSVLNVHSAYISSIV